jgi:hypothetical protein
VEIETAFAAALVGSVADEILLGAAFIAFLLGMLGVLGLLVFTVEFLTTGFDALPLARIGRISVSAIAPGTNVTTLIEFNDASALRRTHRSTGDLPALRHTRLYHDPASVEAVVRHAETLIDEARNR